MRYSEGALPTDFTYTGQRDVPGTGLIFMHARYYHAGLGRFASADTIVPGTAVGADGGLGTIGYSDQMRLAPLTVGFHEIEFLGILNVENQELLEFGPPALWDRQRRQERNAPTGPANPQALNRYAYCLGNPLKYVDPTGHDGWIIVHRESWGPLTQAEADAANKSFSQLWKGMNTILWAEIGLLIPGGITFASQVKKAVKLVAVKLALIPLESQVKSDLREGDHGFTTISYNPDLHLYVQIEYLIDENGTVLFYQQLQSWDPCVKLKGVAFWSTI